MKKKIYKALSIFLTIMIVFSACLCMFSTVTAATEQTYVVSSTGDDAIGDGSTPRKALKTVGKAIELANAAGLKEGDTVNVRVYGTTAVAWLATGVKLPAHSFKLLINSYSSSASSVATVGNGASVNMGGDVDFENIKVDFGATEGVFAADGHTISFPTSVTFVGDGAMSAYAAGSYNASQGTEFNKPISVENVFPFAKFFLGSYSGNATFNESVNISYTNATAPTFYLTGKNGTTTYNKALNLIVNATTASSYTKAENSTLAFGADAYMQVYNSSGYSIKADDLADVPAGKLYVINNLSGNSKLLELTDTKGVYKVNVKSPDHKVIATNVATGVETLYNNTTMTLTLEPGVYDVRLDRGPMYENYYVDSEVGAVVVAGTRPDGLGTEANPVKTYADATRLIAQDGMTDMDVATIILPSGMSADWGDNAEELECQVIITSKMAGEPATISKSAAIEVNADITLKNVKLDIPSSFTEHRALRLNGHNFTVEDDAYASVNYLYLLGNNTTGKVQENDQTVIANGTLLTNYIDFGSCYGSDTFKGDIDIIYDDPSSYLHVRFGSGQETEINSVYEGDINIIVKSASDFSMAIRNQNKADAEIKGKLNVIVDDSVDTTYNFKEEFLKTFQTEGGMWYINNSASDFDFVEFTAEKGKLSVKDGATAYTRQADKDQVTHTGGTIDLSAAPGVYTVSDKAIDPILPEDPHKMLYFRTSGGAHLLTSLATVTPGKTYRFEYSIYTSLYEDCSPTIRTNGDKLSLVTPKVISEEKIGDYYRIVCEGTIPETYSMSMYAHFCVMLPSYAEGVIFDRKVYEADDTEKKDVYKANPDFHDGLDHQMLDTAFFGLDFTGTRGGIGRTKWTNGTQTLEVMDFDLSYIKYLMNLNNPNDGEWWDKDDILSEQEFVTYGSANGTFVDQNGKAVKGAKFLLISDDNTYSAVTDSKGKFDFGKVVTGFYELFIQDGEGKIRTGFNAFISQNDKVEFKVVTDTSGIVVDTNVEDNTQQDTNFETNTEDEPVVEIVASGGLQGTVYTPNLEVVPGLKLVLEGFDDVITDKDGKFGFANIPVGEYELYAVNSDGSKFVFNKYEIKENINLDVKLKYDPQIDTIIDEGDNGWIIWVIVASVLALLVVAALVFFLVIKKKKN